MDERSASVRLAAAAAAWAAYVKRWGLLYSILGKRLPAAEVAAAKADAIRLGEQVIRDIGSGVQARIAPLAQFRARGLDRLMLERVGHWKTIVESSSKATRLAMEQVSKIDGIADLWKRSFAGRRFNDDIRKVSLKALEKAFAAESPIFQGTKELVEALRPLAKDGLNLVIPINKPPYGRTMMYNVEAYAKMVAKTTVREAEQESFFAEADRLGTSLVKMPHLNRDYAAEGDEVCARINGRIFSIEPGGSKGKKTGNKYPYLYGPEGIGNTGYLTAHPNCRHIARPIPEEIA